MTFQREAPRACCIVSLIAALCYLCTPGRAAAQLPATCPPPSALSKALAAKPAASVYDALGASFAGQGQLQCALAAFEQAVRVEPGSAEAHYDYGVGLVRAEKLQPAEQQFRLALKADPAMTMARASLGSVLLDTGKTAEAENEFREVLKSDPKSVFALDHLAQALSAERHYDAAMTYWQQALSLQPTSEDIKLSLATAAYESGLAKQEAGIPGARDAGAREAIRLLQELTSANPLSKLAHFTLGNIFAREQRFREAADEYAATVRADATDTVALLAEVKALDTVSAYQEALTPAQNYVRIKPADPEGHLLLGAVYRGLGEYSKAEPELQRAVAGNANEFQSRYQLGFVLARLDKPKEALFHLKKAVQLKPEDSSAQFQLSAVLRALGDSKQATEVADQFKKAKEKEFKVSQLAAQGNKANQYLNSGQPAQAAAVYREMLQMEPDNAHTYYNLALALEAANDTNGAQEALEKAVSVDPKMALARSELGRVYLARGDVQSAKRWLEQAIALDPQLVPALGNLGVICAQERDTAKAESLFRQALEADPNYAQGNLNLGLILAQQQKYSEAESQLQKALELLPDDSRTLSAIGKVECRLGKNKQGLAYLERVTKLEPNSAAAHLDLAIAEADSYDLTDALTEADTSVRLAPNAAATHFNKGAMLFDLGRPAEARPEFETAIRLSRQMPQPHYYLAVIAKQAGDYDTAINNLQSVVKLQPQNLIAWHLLGQCLQSESKLADAIAAWKHALAIDPEYGQTLWNLGRALKQSDPAESAKLLHKFDEVQRRNKILDRAGTLNNDAAALMQQGEWNAAAAKLKEALQICNNCAVSQDIHKNLGLIYCHAGDIDNGEKELRLAAATKPGDPDVQRALTLIAQVRSKQAQSLQQVR